MRSRKDMNLCLTILIIIALVNVSCCNYFSKRTQVLIGNEAFSSMMNAFIKHFQRNPKEAFLLMRDQIKLRVNFQNKLSQRV